jgi:hypothetical protein
MPAAKAHKLPYTLMIDGAHGRTRTCTFLRNQALYPVELRVR